MRAVRQNAVMLTVAILQYRSIITGAYTAPSSCGVGAFTSRSGSGGGIARARHPIDSRRRSIHGDDGDDAPPPSAAEDGDGNPETAVVRTNDSGTPSPVRPPRLRKRDVFRNTLRRLANLSLKDYEWRSNIFQSNEADRSVEESLARMMGENPSYVRPMDAPDETRGPLGRAEKDVVTWLGSVIEEEGRRAKQISKSKGDLVRPIDVDGNGVVGPLAKLEGAAVTFVESIIDSEMERVNNNILRPKDVDETKRGPLGNAEAKIVQTVEQIAASERIRMERTKEIGGREVVRPIDVPGPMGDVEAKVVEAMEAEKLRSKERIEGDLKRLRPMDASVPGPLGNAERNAMEGLDRLKEEETERLKNIGRFINEKRPMEVDRESTLGLTEAFTVGLVRSPILVGKVAGRVKELISSKPLDKNNTMALMPEAAEVDDVLEIEAVDEDNNDSEDR